MIWGYPHLWKHPDNPPAKSAGLQLSRRHGHRSWYAQVSKSDHRRYNRSWAQGVRNLPAKGRQEVSPWFYRDRAPLKGIRIGPFQPSIFSKEICYDWWWQLKYFWNVHPEPWKWSNLTFAYFSNGLNRNHQTRLVSGKGMQPQKSAFSPPCEELGGRWVIN